jgi:maleylacetate reductase
MSIDAFDWVDGERTIHFGRGRLEQAVALLGGGGYTLLTTPRAAAAACALLEAAGAIHEVPPGRVDELAAGLREEVRADRGKLLVALGGGRVIDTAKALAAAEPPRRVAAVPTTLSGAEMTSIHRQAVGVSMGSAPRVRPALIINDPALSASQPRPELAASACNALGHAFEGPLTPLRHPLAIEAARHAAQLIVGAFGPRGQAGAGVEDDDEARDELALGALLAGYVIGTTHYGLHHIVSQTLVRLAEITHGQANAIMLPHSLGALNRRFPERIAELAASLGEAPAALAERIGAQTGATRLREVIENEAVIERCAEAAATRPDLALTPPPAGRDELLELYRSAW